MIDLNKRFEDLTLREVSEELAEHYKVALVDPTAWNQSSSAEQEFAVFGEAGAALHNLIQALYDLRYGDGLAPWEMKAEKIEETGENVEKSSLNFFNKE